MACVARPCLAAESSNEGLYLGLFGGAGSNSSTSLQQRGAVFLNPPNHLPLLPIHASGETGGSDLAIVGAHVGYTWTEWAFGQGWKIQPALEIEGVYFGTHSPTGEMPVRPQALGTQYVNVPITAGVYTANAVFVIETPYTRRVAPYVGVGVGAAFLSINGSDSANPSEPGINHFNSDPDASDSTLALQLKMGAKSEIYQNLFVFLEYRYVSLESTAYTFGPTDYPGLHLPTASWRVDMGRMEYNLVVAGVQHRF